MKTVYRLLFFWMFLAFIFQTADPITVQAKARGQAASESIGYECGLGEQLPEWALCIYGQVLLVHSNGQPPTPLSGAVVTIAYQDQSLQTTTALRLAHTAPDYALEISSLVPRFLEPVSVTIEYRGAIYRRELLIFPNFATQTQRFDIWLPEAEPFSLVALTGSVADFAATGSVAGATVTLEYNGKSLVHQTAALPEEPYPLYRFTWDELTALGVTPGAAVKLTAGYNGDTSSRAVILSGVEEDPAMANFVTGWKCDDFDPLPRTGGGEGFPRTGGGEGFPDLACFWGYVVVDGEAQDNLPVEIQVDGKTYSSTTRLFPSESQPRFGIGIWGASALNGKPLVVTAIFQANQIRDQFVVGPDENNHQEITLTWSSAGVLGNFTSGNSINVLKWHKGQLWAGTDGGLVIWNPVSKTYVILGPKDGLYHSKVTSIAFSSYDGTAWIGTANGGVSHYNPADGTFKNYDLKKYWLYGEDIQDIAENSADGKIWVAKRYGTYFYDPALQNWQYVDYKFTPETILIDSERNVIWFGSQNGIYQYNLTSQVMQNYRTINGMSIQHIRVMGKDPKGRILFCEYTNQILDIYDPITGTWEQITVPTDILPRPYSFFNGVVTSKGTIWLVSNTGVIYFQPETNIWKSFTTVDGLKSNVIQHVAADEEGQVAVAFSEGISLYDPTTETWESLGNAGVLSVTQISKIVADRIGNIWFKGDIGIYRYNSLTRTTQHIGYGEALASDRDGNIWFSRGSIQFYNVMEDRQYNLNFQNSTQITNIFPDPDGTMWFALYNRNVIHYFPDTQAVVTYDTNSVLPASNSHTFTDLMVDRTGKIWLAMWSGGSGYYDPVNNTWNTNCGGKIFFEDKDGKIWIGGGVYAYEYSPNTGKCLGHLIYGSGSIEAITGDLNGNIWFGMDGGRDYGSPGGIAQYDSQTNTFRKITTAEGLVSDRVLALAVDRSNNLWVGSLNGISQVHIPHLLPDLSVSLAGPFNARAGEDIQYTLSVTNQGTDPTSANASLSLPPQVSLVGSTLPPVQTTPLRWNLTDIAPMQSVSITITVHIPIELATGSKLSATAQVTSNGIEEFKDNNDASLTTNILSPNHADLRIMFSGPPTLSPGETSTFNVWIDNTGTLPAADARLDLTLPDGLSFISSDPSPTSTNPIAWSLGSVPEGASPLKVTMQLKANPDLAVGQRLVVRGQVSTSTLEEDGANNLAETGLVTVMDDALTLVLAAPARVAARYGASDLWTRLNQWATHPSVRGVVVDVETDPGVRAAYAAWDADPQSWRKANAVAKAIKAVIDHYTITYPHLRYLVLAGGDDILPFYRVSDQAVLWPESAYRQSLPWGTIRSALGAEQFLTDDFYADRQATIPTSRLWFDRHPLYLPDFAIGRLVGQPEDMIAMLQNFLAHDGVVELTGGLVGGDGRLAQDLRDAQCHLLREDGITVDCVPSDSDFKEKAIKTLNGMVWSAFHSNHTSLGPLSAKAIAERSAGYGNVFFATIGCHAGLPERSLSGDIGLVQALNRQGTSFVAPTAYAYGSPYSIGYSEKLAYEFTRQLLKGNVQEIGPALVRAKQQYYVNSPWFSALDEKVLMPVTLFGLPMLRVTTPGSAEVDLPIVSKALEMKAGVPIEEVIFDAQDVHRNDTPEGSYFDLNGQVVASDGVPIQPLWSKDVQPQQEGRVVKGVLLKRADYQDLAGFNPLWAQAWAMSAPPPEHLSESSDPLPGWDRDLPYALNRFDGLSSGAANLSIVPGVYHGPSQTQRLFQHMTLQLVYGSPEDTQPPQIRSQVGMVDQNQHSRFFVTVADDRTVAQVQVVYDDGAGHWQVLDLVANNQGWSGSVNIRPARYFVQVVDADGNVTAGAWATPIPGQSVYLPLAQR